MKEAAKPIHPRLINDFSTLLSVEEQLVRKNTHRSITSEMAIKRCSLSKRSSPIGEVTVPSLADTSPNRNLCSCQPNMVCVPYSNSRRIQCGGPVWAIYIQAVPTWNKSSHLQTREPSATRAIYKECCHKELGPFTSSAINEKPKPFCRDQLELISRSADKKTDDIYRECSTTNSSHNEQCSQTNSSPL